MGIEFHIINSAVVIVDLGIDSILENLMHRRCHLQDGGQQLQLARYDQNANKKICQQGPLASSFSSNNSKTESQLLPLLCVFSITVSWHWRLHVRVRVITRQLQSRKNIIIIYKILKFYDFFTLKKSVTILNFFLGSMQLNFGQNLVTNLVVN